MPPGSSIGRCYAPTLLSGVTPFPVEVWTMKYHARSPRYLCRILCVATLLAASVMIRPRPMAAAQDVPEPLASFAAAHIGGFTLSDCPLLGILRTNCKLSLNGVGQSSFLDDDRETGNLTANLNLLPLECGSMRGQLRLTDNSNRNNVLIVAVIGNICAPLLGGILGGRAPYTLGYRITGGEGAYRTARGEGVISGALRLNLLAGTGNYFDTWQGTCNNCN
jgi:hypothetical protein